ncbi:hypothetical protein K2173_016413 [Erythroxylum novogranatense]|uniref:Uncharacterized protein n=1 Tax=Erythroxylum novogranatense TaxID=1862640 RepID=A0AAV8SGA7_9ROSI|nr:hypothetical protein K2173_016413 [Erythroxylum novogranatense]
MDHSETKVLGHHYSALNVLPINPTNRNCAKVKAECRARKSMELLFSKEATTDYIRSYTFEVDEDQIGDVSLVSIPLEGCSKPSLGRDRSGVILTRENGIASDDRYANAMGFMKDQPEVECNEILKQYRNSKMRTRFCIELL